MATHEQQITVDVTPDVAYDYLADPANLPHYLPETKKVVPADGDNLVITAVVEIPDQGDTEVTNEAWFRTEPDTRTISWGSDNHNDYHGQLTVNADREAKSTVIAISIHSLNTETDKVLDGITGALQTIKSKLER